MVLLGELSRGLAAPAFSCELTNGDSCTTVISTSKRSEQASRTRAGNDKILSENAWSQMKAERAVDILTLKWGTVKFLAVGSESARKAAETLEEEKHSEGWSQLKEKKALCNLIDSIDAETIYLEWDELHVSKEMAKKYVMEYQAASS